MKRREVERERRPARNRSVEKVDREVARESAVGEPATRQTRLSPLPPLVLRRVAEVESPQRYGADQDGKAKAHPDRHDDREIARAREGDEIAPGGNRVEPALPSERGAAAPLHERDHPRRKERGGLARVEVEPLRGEGKA